MKKFVFLLEIFCICLIATTIGCQNERLKGLVPAEGIVLYNGQPVDGASVRFAPEIQGSDARSGHATTDQEGRFKIMTLDPGDGIAPGNYKVAIQKMTEPPRPEGIEDMDDSERAEFSYMKDEVEYLLPRKYSAAASSGLSVTVPPEGIKDIKFELTD